MKTLVIAHYNEDLSWVENVSPLHVEVLTKATGEGDAINEAWNHLTIAQEPLPNIGREPHSYFYFIVENYDYLEGMYFFTQGNPFPHEPRFLELLNEDFTGFQWLGQHPYTSKPDGKPQDSGLDLHKVSAVWGAEPQDEYGFRASCIVAVDAETIKRHPKRVYEELLELMTKDRNPWAMERLWGSLWG